MLQRWLHYRQHPPVPLPYAGITYFVKASSAFSSEDGAPDAPEARRLIRIVLDMTQGWWEHPGVKRWASKTTRHP